MFALRYCHVTVGRAKLGDGSQVITFSTRSDITKKEKGYILLFQ